ncbi:MAG: OPT/YSL family transporter [Hyphomicrobiales bacterium]|nr:OPT/YSL family transporter [Hyphomicrobiales bacterium]MBV8823395.1 OPT/YSL family transporter [Hyphomicrobiales bacterium]MBV9426674.1 OPT/YSL family transporter [Bradyrhizobiaceae bacterium]
MTQTVAEESVPPADLAAEEADRPLPVAPFKGTPEEIERQWYEEVYRGRGDSMAQLTWRAVLIGSCLGAVLSLTNLYIGLKAGWGFGVAITACILSYAIWTGLLKVGLVRTPMTILENNCMQSTASSAGYSTGGTLISAFAAYIIINRAPLSVPLMMTWVFFIAILGVTMAIPMKRQMINIEQLRFPSGVAAAETLRALHAKTSHGMRAAKALGLAGLIAALDKFWAEGLSSISASLERFSSGTLLTGLQKWLLGSHYEAWAGRTVVFSWDFIFVAAGAIIGMRVCATMLISGTLCWAVVVPILQAQGVITGAGFAPIVQWTLWFGASCMVAAGLLSFALSWRTALRAFHDLGQMVSFRSDAAGGYGHLEAPMSWFAAGQIVSLVALAWLAHASFGMPVWQSVVAVALSFLLALVACRVTGETDTTPVGAMGKVTQLAFGALSPGNVNVNLMSANITAGAATSSADLLTDLKSGYLLGANPRQQFIAQFSGIFVGTVVTVLTFAVLVPDANVLGTDQFPAPAAQTWSAVAIALSKGLSSLEPLKLWLIVAGAAVGVALTLAPVLLPRYQEYLPSAAAFGLAWVFNWYYGLLFFLGALIALVIGRRKPALADEFTLPVASGVIAGGSLMGVALVFWANGGSILGKLFGG